MPKLNMASQLQLLNQPKPHHRKESKIMTTQDDNSTNEDEKRGPGRPREELTPIAGDNIKGLEGDIRDAFKTIDQLGKDRDAINQKVQATREDLYAKGIPKEAFDLARNYANWPEDKRRNFDLAFAICREAVGMPMQSDFLDQLNDEK